MSYDPAENIARVKRALDAAIRGAPSVFAGDDRNLLAVFCGSPRATDQSRIVAFQKFLAISLPARPIVASVRPGCLRVWFAFPESEDGFTEQLKELISSEEFSKVCESLGIDRVVCGTKMVRFAESDFS